MHCYRKTSDGFLSPLIPILLLKLFLLRWYHPPEGKLGENNILANIALWNSMGGVVNRSDSRERISVVKTTVPQISYSKVLVKFELYGVLKCF